MLPIKRMTEKVSTFINEIPKTSMNSTYNFDFHFPSAQEKRQKLNEEKARFEAERPMRVQAMIHNIIAIAQKKLNQADEDDDYISILCPDIKRIHMWDGEDWDDLEQALLEVGRMLEGMGYRVEYIDNPFNHKIYCLKAHW